MQRNHLLLVGQFLLDGSANGTVLVEVLSDHACLVQRTADGLSGAADSSVRCVIPIVSDYIVKWVLS